MNLNLKVEVECLEADIELSGLPVVSQDLDSESATERLLLMITYYAYYLTPLSFFFLIYFPLPFLPLPLHSPAALFASFVTPKIIAASAANPANAPRTLAS